MWLIEWFKRLLPKAVKKKLNEWWVLHQAKHNDKYLSIVLLVDEEQKQGIDELMAAIGGDDIVELFNISLGLLGWTVEQLQTNRSICAVEVVDGQPEIVVTLEPDIFEHVRAAHVENMRVKFQKLFDQRND